MRFRWFVNGFVLLLALVLAANAQPWIQTAAAEKLSGPVKSLDHLVVLFWMVDGKVVPGETRSMRGLAFNRSGYGTESISYDHKGKLVGKTVYTFDASGRPDGSRTYSPTDTSPVLKHVQDQSFKRDRAGRITEYFVTDANGSIDFGFTYEFDEAGNLVEERGYNRMGAQGSRTLFTYEPQTRRKTQTHYDSSGKQTSKLVKEHDSQDRVILEHQYRGTILKFEIRTRYDNKGRPLEQITVEFNSNPNEWVSHGPRPGRLVYRYDDAERRVELSRFDSGDSLKTREVRWFDANGSEIEMAEYGPDGNEIPMVLSFYDDISKPDSPFRGSLSGRRITRFEYDRHGIWIRKSYFLRTQTDAQLVMFREEIRKISYF